ncbi:folD, partial [Symbiodinium sp. KB8]
AGLPQLARAGRRVSQPAVGAPVSVLRRAQNDLRALWGHLGIKVGLAVPAAGGLDWELLVLDCGKVSVLSAARLRRGDRIVRVQEETELRAMIARLALLDSCGENEPQVVELEVEFRTLAEAASVAETAMPLKCQGLDLSDWEDDDLPSLPSYSENSRSLDILAGAGESRERTMMIRLRRVIRGLREAEIQVILDKMILQGEPLVSASSPGDSDAIAVEAERLSQTLLRVAGFQEDDDDKKAPFLPGVSELVLDWMSAASGSGELWWMAAKAMSD